MCVTGGPRALTAVTWAAGRAYVPRACHGSTWEATGELGDSRGTFGAIWFADGAAMLKHLGDGQLEGNCKGNWENNGGTAGGQLEHNRDALGALLAGNWCHLAHNGRQLGNANRRLWGHNRSSFVSRGLLGFLKALGGVVGEVRVLPGKARPIHPAKCGRLRQTNPGTPQRPPRAPRAPPGAPQGPPVV